MTLGRFISVAALAAGVVLTAPSAYARDDEPTIRLTGGVRLAPALEALGVSPLAVPTQVTETATAEAQPQRASAPIVEDRGSASALPWHQRFTVAPSETRSVWGQPAEAFQLQAGDRWGVTLGYTEQGRGSESVDLQDFSAGAFFEFSEYLRVGGAVRFTSPEEEIFGEEGEDRTPEIRFESAFRF